MDTESGQAVMETSEQTEEVTPDLASVDVKEETVKEVEAALSGEEVKVAPTDKQDSKSDAIDWFDTSTWGDKDPKDVVSEIQKQWISKSEEISRLKKDSINKGEYETLQRSYDALHQDVLSTLADENKYKKYREDYLKTSPSKTSDVTGDTRYIDQLKNKILQGTATTDELLEYNDEKLKTALAAKDKEYDQRLQAELNKLAAPIAEDKWKNALSTTKDKYPEVFDKYETQVISMITKGKFKSLYGAMNEEEILDTAFKALAFEDAVNSAEQRGKTTAQESFDAKKKGVTNQSGRHMSVQSPINSKADAIAEVERMLGK